MQLIKQIREDKEALLNRVGGTLDRFKHIQRRARASTPDSEKSSLAPASQVCVTRFRHLAASHAAAHSATLVLGECKPLGRCSPPDPR